MGSEVTLNNLQCRYRGETVVHSVTFHVKAGRVACLLGPSGCGKTTILRAIAGLEPIAHGEIIIGAESVSRPGYTRAPEKRRLGMVFQDYALFPHLSIFDNISFGLRRETSAAAKRITFGLLEMVGLTGLEGRYPHQLSGGQQQRVALARALAPKPTIILLDEPFSNLDIEMRERLGIDVREILEHQGVTGILVTHHQDEAFMLADHVGVLSEGRLLQWDTPFNIYHEPNNKFVADFIGQGVFLNAIMGAPDTLETEFGTVTGDRAYSWPKGTPVELLIRPDDVTADPTSALRGSIVKKAFKGAEILYSLQLTTGSQLLALFPSHHNHAIGDEIGLKLDLQHLVVFAGDTKQSR